MADKRWMIYGATGYTGPLIAEEAVRRGHRPLLAGRSARKLKPLAERLDLEHVAVGLDDPAALALALKDVELVLHCAGPYSATASPMLRACLSSKTHYLDLAGEIPSIENVFAFNSSARQQGIALIPACGFDVIPTECLAKYVADKVPSAFELDIAIDGVAGMSAGTAVSGVEIIARGGMERRNGRLVLLPVASESRTVRFPRGERHVVCVPWGDLAAAYRSTSIPNITTYFAMKPGTARLARIAGGIALGLFWFKGLRWLAQKLAAVTIKGPDEEARRSGRTYVWARAADLKGASAEAWLEIDEAYQFTAKASVQAVEKTLGSTLAGAFSPAQAFGADFVLSIEGTKRFDTL